MARTHVILVNWNGWQDSAECLESLLRLSETDFDVTICDNGSTDGSVERLVDWLEGRQQLYDPSPKVWSRIGVERHHLPTYSIVAPDDPIPQSGQPFVTIVAGRQNLGFAGGNNIGIRRALADPACRYIWLLNNDTVVGPDALAALVARMEATPEIAVCGSTLLFYGAPDTVQGLGGWFNLWIARGAHIGYRRDAADLPRREEVEAEIAYVMGASMFVRRAVFERTGGLCKDYFLYNEEIDLARRLLKNERQAWAANSIVYHKEGGSIGTTSVGRPSNTSVYYLCINLLRFYRKFHPVLLPLALARNLRELRKYRRSGDGDAAECVRLAIADFLAGRHHTGPVAISAPERRQGSRVP